MNVCLIHGALIACFFGGWNLLGLIIKLELEIGILFMSLHVK